jgi:hypothetical protein
MVKAIKARSICSRMGHKWTVADGYTPDGLFLGECSVCGRKVWRQHPFKQEAFMYDEIPVWATVLRNTVLSIGAILMLLFWVYLLWPLFQ